MNENKENNLQNCRVCDKPEDYANLFYNINRELLSNLTSLVQTEVLAAAASLST